MSVLHDVLLAENERGASRYLVVKGPDSRYLLEDDTYVLLFRADDGTLNPIYRWYRRLAQPRLWYDPLNERCVLFYDRSFLQYSMNGGRNFTMLAVVGPLNLNEAVINWADTGRRSIFRAQWTPEGIEVTTVDGLPGSEWGRATRAECDVWLFTPPCNGPPARKGKEGFVHPQLTEVAAAWKWERRLRRSLFWARLLRRRRRLRILQDRQETSLRAIAAIVSDQAAAQGRAASVKTDGRQLSTVPAVGAVPVPVDIERLLAPYDNELREGVKDGPLPSNGGD